MASQSTAWPRHPSQAVCTRAGGPAKHHLNRSLQTATLTAQVRDGEPARRGGAVARHAAGVGARVRAAVRRRGRTGSGRRRRGGAHAVLPPHARVPARRRQWAAAGGRAASLRHDRRGERYTAMEKRSPTKTLLTLRARWVTLRARWVTLRARWVSFRWRRWVRPRAWGDQLCAPSAAPVHDGAHCFDPVFRRWHAWYVPTHAVTTNLVRLSL